MLSLYICFSLCPRADKHVQPTRRPLIGYETSSLRQTDEGVEHQKHVRTYRVTQHFLELLVQRAWEPRTACHAK